MADELEKVNQQYIIEFVPAIVIIIIIIVVGLSGNAFAAFYYGFRAPKSVVQFLMFALALNDAVSNLMFVDEVSTLLHFVTYSNHAVCKVFHFLLHWLTGNSLLLILAIAVDRFRRVCFPFSSQITVRGIRFAILGLCVFSFALSARYFVTADAIVVNLTYMQNKTKGFYCTFSEDAYNASVEGAFNYIDICLHSGTVCSLIVLYSLIVRKIVKSKNKVKIHKRQTLCVVHFKKENPSSDKSDEANSKELEFRSTETNDSKGEGTDVTDDKCSAAGPTCNSEQTHSSNDDTENASDLNKVDGTFKLAVNRTFREPKFGDSLKIGAKPERPRKNKRMTSEVRITVMVAVITLVSILCFVPYYVSILLVENNFSGHGLIMTVGNIITRKSYTLNSAVNPVVLLAFDLEFRKCVKTVLGNNTVIQFVHCHC